MSKKKLLTIIIPCVVVVVLVAVFLIVYFRCFTGDFYDELNQIANGKHNNISIKITTQTDDATLTSTFSVVNGGNRSVVNYSVENFAPINDDTGVDDDDTVTSVGRVVIEGGKVSEQTGDKVDVNFGNVTQLTFHFAEINFEEVQTTNGIFSAKVTRPQSFLDSPSLVCTNMTVTFAYKGNAENVMVIRYTSEGGAAVTITYTFS